MAALLVGSLAVAVWAWTDSRSKIASANESWAEAVKYVDECRAITKSAVESEAAARAERDSLKSALEKRDAEWVSGVQKLNADSRAGFPATH